MLQCIHMAVEQIDMVMINRLTFTNESDVFSTVIFILKLETNIMFTWNNYD